MGFQEMMEKKNVTMSVVHDSKKIQVTQVGKDTFQLQICETSLKLRLRKWWCNTSTTISTRIVNAVVEYADTIDTTWLITLDDWSYDWMIVVSPTTCVQTSPCLPHFNLSKANPSSIYLVAQIVIIF